VLLRYLSQLYKTLDQTVPEPAKTEGVWDALGFFRALVETTDSSLFEEWQGLLHPEVLVRTKERATAREILWLQELLADPKTFASRCGRRCTLLVRALSLKDWEEAGTLVKQDPDDPQTSGTPSVSRRPWPPSSRSTERSPSPPKPAATTGPRSRRRATATWNVAHTMLDPQGDNLWAIQGTIDLRDPDEAEGPIVRGGADWAVRGALAGAGDDFSRSGTSSQPAGAFHGGLDYFPMVIAVLSEEKSSNLLGKSRRRLGKSFFALQKFSNPLEKSPNPLGKS